MNKQERAYAIIRERILDGTYGPGYRLVIDQLARELGVSALPVREAIRRLEAEGWVLFRPHAGAQVAPVDPQQWVETMGVLAVLEAAATAQAAPHVTPGDLERLQQINDRMQAALEGHDVQGFSDLNRRFHFAIYDRCPNQYLVDVLTQAWDRLDQMRRTIFHIIPHRGRESCDEHRRIIDLLAVRAPADEIERVVREHKLHTIEAYRLTARTPVSAGRAGEGDD
ncbi:MAG TPA: GntR family transcriptional regulator [Bacillota bacterium]